MQWFKSLSAKVKLVVGFLTLCVITGTVGGIGIQKMSILNENSQLLYARELVGLSAIKEANINLIYIGRATRQAVMETDPAATAKNAQLATEAYDRLQKQLADYEKTVVTDEARQKVSELKDVLDRYMVEITAVLALAESESNSEALSRLAVSRELATRADTLMSEVSRVKEGLAEESNTENAAAYAAARWLMLGLVCVGILIGVLMGLYFANWFGRALVETATIADSVASASQQLAAASEEISSGAQEQASSLEETASSIEEITSTVRQNADNAQQAAQLAAASRDVAERGGKVVSEAVTAMTEINHASKRISDIIGTIDEIAFQTNILALNAAVEAARAGEQGRGFAVVATEVRNLAQRSASAAKEIKTLIQDSVRKVDAGSALVDRSGQALQEILTSVKRVTDIVSEIAAASREQTTGIEQVSKAIAQMDSVTQANASQTEELSSTAEALSSQGEQLRAVVAQFNLDTTGSGGATPAPRRSPTRRTPATLKRKMVTSSSTRSASHDNVYGEPAMAGAGASELDTAFEVF